MNDKELSAAIRKKGNFLCCLNWKSLFADLSDEETGMIINAIFVFSETGERTSFNDRTLNAVFRSIMCDIERMTESYIDRCRKNAENGKKSHISKSSVRNNEEQQINDDEFREGFDKIRQEKIFYSDN